MSAFYLDDLPLTDLGFVGIPPLTDWRDSIRQAWGESALPGRTGGAPLLIASGKSRTFTIWGRFEGASASAYVTLIDTLRREYRGIRKFRVSDDTSRFLWVRFMGDEVQTMSPRALTNIPRKVGLTFVATDPAWYDLHPRSVSLPASTYAEIPCGTLPSAWIAYRQGALNSGVASTLRYYGVTGALLGQITVTPTVNVGSNDAIEVDGIKGRITHIASDGTRTVRNSWKTAGQSYFAITPADSDPLGPMPRVGWSSGSGLILIRRAWS